MNPHHSTTRYAPGDAAPPPLRARPEHEILASWGDSIDPVVSIICATYQHASFLEDALHGFLSQKTSFPFEVLVRDDASTDGTAEIVAEMQKAYPRIIRAVLESENGWPEQQTAFILQPRAKGEFIAFCEGDDYWTDPLHLQTLVTALREMPEASAVFSPTAFIRDGKTVRWFQFEGDLSDRLVIPHFPGIPLAALCVRNLPVAQPPMHHRIASLDRYHLSVWAKAGPLRLVAHAAPTVYRMHDGGTWSPRPALERAPLVAESYVWIAHWWRSQGDPELAREFERAAIKRLASVLPDAEMIVRTRRFPAMRRLKREGAQLLAKKWPWAHATLKKALKL